MKFYDYDCDYDYIDNNGSPSYFTAEDIAMIEEEDAEDKFKLNEMIDSIRDFDQDAADMDLADLDRDDDG